MKKIIFIFILLLAFSLLVYADTLNLSSKAIQGIEDLVCSDDTVPISCNSSNEAAVNGPLNVSGIISGSTDLTLVTDATLTLTASDFKNKVIYNDGVSSLDSTLPGAESGLTGCFYDLKGNGLVVDPVDATDTIYLDGTSVGAGHAIDSSGSVGDYICLMAVDDTRWITWGRSGIWVDGGVD